jgi:acyl carrier protein
MPEEVINEAEIRERILKVLEEVRGFAIEPREEDLSDIDSLQVLELLVSLEEEFDIDSDLIIASRPDWWSSLAALTQSIGSSVGGNLRERG